MPLVRRCIINSKVLKVYITHALSFSDLTLKTGGVILTANQRTYMYMRPWSLANQKPPFVLMFSRQMSYYKTLQGTSRVKSINADKLLVT